MQSRLTNTAEIARAVIAGVLAGVILSGCAKETPESGPGGPDARRPAAVPMVEVATVERTTLARELALTGEVVVRRRALVSPMVEGVIAEFPLAEGDFVVEAGEVLAVIDRPLYRAERDAASAGVEVARAKLADLQAGVREEEIAEARATVSKLEAEEAFAQAELARVRRLVEAETLSSQDLERAETTHQQAASDLEGARQRLKQREAGSTPTALAVARAQLSEAEARRQLAEEKVAECRITAPFAGVISHVYVVTGDMAVPRSPLLEMYDPASAVVRFTVPEWAAQPLEIGMHARVRFDALGTKFFDARVIRVFPRLDQTTRTRMAEAQVDEEIELAPGMFARLELTLELADEALVVPNEALIALPGEGRAVMVVREGRLERVPVSLGIEEPARSQVSGDLIPGEMVAVFGHEDLRPGTEVRVRERGDSPPPEPESGSTEQGSRR